MTKSLRPGKIFVDWSQNNPAKTTVAPYSLRARDEPTVSTPLDWDEVAAGRASSRFTAAEVLRPGRRARRSVRADPGRRGPDAAHARRWLLVSRLSPLDWRVVASGTELRGGRDVQRCRCRLGRPRPRRPAAPLGPPQATARRGPAGLRRQRLPRRGDGRHRRAGRGVQAGALPALPGQARAVPRPARHPGRDAARRGHRRAGRHRRQPRAHPRRAHRLLRLRRPQRRRRRVPAHLRDRPGQRAGRARPGRGGRPRRRCRPSPTPSPATPGSTGPRPNCCRPPSPARRRWRPGGGWPATGRSRRPTPSGCSNRCCGGASRTSRARATRPH